MTITFRLEGPMQAWGDHSAGNYKDTCSFPTKSGVIGLIGAALGLKRSDSKLADISKSVTMVVRADRAGTRMTDYHTVQYKKSNGDIATEETYRDYLQDAHFLVALEGDEALLKEIVEAFKAPKWILYLGRKACLPSRPIIASAFDGTALEAIRSIDLADRSDDEVFYEAEAQDGYWKQDVTTGYRTFDRRLVNIFKI